MVTTCATPTCLRPPADGMDMCKPCSVGGKPLTNPQSPHAAQHSFSPRVMKDGKPIKDGSVQMGVPTVRVPKPGTGTATPKVTISPKNQIKTSLSTQDSKKAVQMIFNSRWWGWQDGLPSQFPDLFAQFGKYHKANVKTSSMVGTPDSHRSQINMSGNAAYVTIMELILPVEGMRSVEKKLRNPIYAEARGAVSIPDMLVAIENDGKTYTFEKVGDGTIYKYEDDKGKEHQLPRWAIA